MICRQWGGPEDLRLEEVKSQPLKAGQKLSENASHSAASLEEISSTMEQMAGQTRQNAENAHKAVSIASAARASAPARVRVSWKGAVAAKDSPGVVAGFQIKPKLYVLAVGVGNYKNPDIPKLDLSVKDARDFANAMQKQEGKLYRSVETRMLLDETADLGLATESLAEFEDLALMKVMAAEGRGFIALPSLAINDAVDHYGFQIIGRADKCRTQLHAITAERRIAHPAVAQITSQARVRLKD